MRNCDRDLDVKNVENKKSVLANSFCVSQQDGRKMAAFNMSTKHGLKVEIRMPDYGSMFAVGSSVHLGRRSPPTIVVSGDIEHLSMPVIVSNDRFVTYEESDLDWAIPLGFCRIDRVPYAFGDRANLSMFCNGMHGDIVCVGETCVDLGGPIARCTVVFRALSDGVFRC